MKRKIVFAFIIIFIEFFLNITNSWALSNAPINLHAFNGIWQNGEVNLYKGEKIYVYATFDGTRPNNIYGNITIEYSDGTSETNTASYIGTFFGTNAAVTTFSSSVAGVATLIANIQVCHNKSGVQSGICSKTIVINNARNNVTFVNYDGNILKTEKIEYGKKVTIPDNLIRNGYVFRGWYIEPEFINEYKEAPIFEDTTLYAKWEKLPFDDVDSNKWYIDGVTYVYKNNIMTGYNATTFGTNSSITRGQIATMLYRLAGSPDTTGLANPFSDVPAGKYYTEPVKWAYSKGITTGKTSTKFDPDGNVTRQELAVFMARYAKEIKGLDTTSTYNITGIADYADLSTWAKAPMQYIMEKGVITGDMKLGYPRILPRNNATRAEAATMFMRFCLNIS